MSLNADVDHEFGPIDASDASTLEAVPQDTLHDGTVTPEDLFGLQTSAGELPKLEKDFEFQTTASNRLIDLQHFQRQLRVTGAISLEDAQAIDAVVPGFINDDTNPAAYYSEAATKTNYSESLNSLGGEIDRQYEDAKTTLADLAGRTAALGKDAMNTMRPQYVECLTGINKAILSLLVASDRELIEQVPYMFGKDARWSKISQLSVYLMSNGEYAECSDSKAYAAARASSFAPFLDRYEAVMVNADARNNLTDFLSYPYPVIWINSLRYKFEANGLMVQDKDSSNEVSSPGVSSLAAVTHCLGTTKVRDWVVQLQASYQTYVGLAEAIPKQLQELDAQEEPLATKIDRVIELNSILNDVRTSMIGIHAALGALFGFMCITKDVYAEMNKAF